MPKSKTAEFITRLQTTLHHREIELRVALATITRMNVAAEKAAADIKNLIAALESVMPDEPCDFDENDVCQAHKLQSPCPVAEAGWLLKRIGK
jgi:hypothetical protein